MNFTVLVILLVGAVGPARLKAVFGGKSNKNLEGVRQAIYGIDLDVISWHGLSRVRWVGIRTETKDAEKNRISQIMKQTEFEKTLRRVGKIATGFPARSQEAQALKRVCEAYIYVHSTDTARKFAEFMMAKNRELTAAQRLHLRAIGIDPDS